MANLAKGSKGSEVKKLQAMLNKLGAKPKLAEDSIFGPKTDAALRAAQKKLKLKADGVCGPLTSASLSYGKPLPEMPVPNYKYDAGMSKAVRKHAETITKLLTHTDKEIDRVDKVIGPSLKDLQAALDRNKAPREQAIGLAEDIYKKQQEFEKIRLKNPAAAEKLGNSILQQDGKLQALQMQMNEELSKMGTAASAFYREVKGLGKTLDKLTGDVESAVKEKRAALKKGFSK